MLEFQNCIPCSMLFWQAATLAIILGKIYPTIPSCIKILTAMGAHPWLFTVLVQAEGRSKKVISLQCLGAGLLPVGSHHKSWLAWPCQVRMRWEELWSSPSQLFKATKQDALSLPERATIHVYTGYIQTKYACVQWSEQSFLRTLVTAVSILVFMQNWWWNIFSA